MACLLHTEYSPGNTQLRRRSESPRIVWQPASHFLQGSSIVPERGKICPGAAASLLQIPDAPQVCNAKRNGFPLRGIVATTSQRSRKVKWAGHTRHVASDFMPPASWDDEFRGTEGLPSSRDLQMPSTAGRSLDDVLWLPPSRLCLS